MRAPRQHPAGPPEHALGVGEVGEHEHRGEEADGRAELAHLVPRRRRREEPDGEHHGGGGHGRGGLGEAPRPGDRDDEDDGEEADREGRAHPATLIPSAEHR